MRLSILRAVVAVVPMTCLIGAGLSLAAPYTVFSDDFEGNTTSFAFPDTVGHPPAAPAVGSWVFANASNPEIAAGRITNATPASNGGQAYMAMRRTADTINKAAAVFSMPVTAANGILDAQWDQYTDTHAYDVGLSTQDGGFGSANVFTFVRFNHPSNADVRVYWDNYNSDTINEDAAPSGQWVHMEMQLDVAAQTYKLFANGVQLGTDWQFNQPVDADYAVNELYFGGTFNDSTIFIDNVKVTVSQVPEPMTGGLVLIGGTLMLLRRRVRAD